MFSSRIDRLGATAVVVLPDDVALVLVMHDPPRPPHDLSSDAPNLVLLSLTEPPGPTGISGPIIEPAQIVLAHVPPLAQHQVSVIDNTLVPYCGAALINPFSAEVIVLDAYDVLAHVAKGFALRIAAATLN
jgi:hypothetical protein